MLKTEVEVDNLKKEIECLREENEKLKQQLSNYNHSTIHNNNNDLESDNYSETENEVIKILTNESIQEYPSYEDMAKGYEEMGQINLELAEM